jgi:GNAT superfamily N-acetyltransferase
MGLTPLEPTQIGTIVTSLEMTARPAPAPPLRAPLKLERWEKPDLDRYRGLYRAVGAPWLWFSRLAMNDKELQAIVHDPDVELHVSARRDGTPVGILELDFRVRSETELAFFGLIPEMTGRGFGGWLMAHALRLAWRTETRRVWVHTCTLDHPGALDFYRRYGFRPFARAVETFADPRLAGLLPREAAPHVPLLG